MNFLTRWIFIGLAGDALLFGLVYACIGGPPQSIAGTDTVFATAMAAVWFVHAMLCPMALRRPRLAEFGALGLAGFGAVGFCAFAAPVIGLYAFVIVGFCLFAPMAALMSLLPTKIAEAPFVEALGQGGLLLVCVGVAAAVGAAVGRLMNTVGEATRAAVNPPTSRSMARLDPRDRVRADQIGGAVCAAALIGTMTLDPEGYRWIAGLVALAPHLVLSGRACARGAALVR